MARQINWLVWPWRRQQGEQQPVPAPTWPVDERGRPVWATEQQQFLPAVKPGDPGYPVYPECGDWR